ncbi:MAG: DUF2147 domain-containing protein, partial [Spirochaetales bacterium]|nr:DUF2147 domain-containing protein [Spirochaetales bacterium]
MKQNKMKIVLALVLLSLFLPASLFAADDVTGLWKMVDDETNMPTGVVAVYKYHGLVYGRLIATFDDDGKTLMDDMYRKIYTSPFIKGEPSYNELTMIWGLKERKTKWHSGKIMDPGDDDTKPKIYDCE